MSVFTSEVLLGGGWDTDDLEMNMDSLPLARYTGRKGRCFSRIVVEELERGISVSRIDKVVYTQSSSGYWVKDLYEVREDWLKAIEHADNYELPVDNHG